MTMTDNKSAAYIEGNYLGGGWSYRINRVVKPKGAVTYSAILTHEDLMNRAEKLYMWLSEFDTAEDARTAAYNVLADWCAAPHYSLNAEDKSLVA